MAYISFQPSDNFSTKLYTGNGTAIGSGGNAITGVGFESDFTWIKQRDAIDNYILTDAVRGATKYLNSDRTNAEATNAESLTSWNSDGFTLGNHAAVNGSGDTFVSWNWKAGTTSGIATNGSTTITPNSYSFNQTSGVSILQYTGNQTDDAKLAHGLGVAPHLVICKEQNVASNDWAAWHISLGNDVMALNTTAAKVAGNSRFSNTAPDAVNITLGSDGSTNLSGNMICYAFAPIKGFSKFGQFTGNANADGAFIYTGFRPSFFMIKRYSSTGKWNVIDDKRQGFNPQSSELYPNSDAAECDTGCYRMDILSNGVKMRNSSPSINDGSYIYAAFAEFPIVSSNSKAGVAR